jgi:hypothetical protein
MIGWSGDLHELTWFFIKTPDFGFHFGRLPSWYTEAKKVDTKYSCWFFKVAWWGIHLSYARE